MVVRHLHLDLRDGRLGTKMEENWCTKFFSAHHGFKTKTVYL